MDSLERIVGQLEGKVDLIQADVASIKADVKSLLESKWKRDGRTGIVAAAVSGAVAGLGFLFGR